MVGALRIDDVASVPTAAVGIGGGRCAPRIDDVVRASMPTASRLGRRHRSDAVSRTARRDRRARNYADGPYMPTAAVGVTLGKRTAVLGRRGPSAYVWIARRLYYADGLDMAVGIAQTRPTGAVGIYMAVGIGPCSGSGSISLD